MTNLLPVANATHSLDQLPTPTTVIDALTAGSSLLVRIIRSNVPNQLAFALAVDKLPRSAISVVSRGGPGCTATWATQSPFGVRPLSLFRFDSEVAAGWHWFACRMKRSRGTASRLYSVVKQWFRGLTSRYGDCLERV